MHSFPFKFIRITLLIRDREHQKPLVTTYASMHHGLGGRHNSRRDDLFRDLEQLAGSAADSENLRRMVDHGELGAQPPTYRS